MKNASKTMFNIGNIFTVVYLILGALLALIGIIVLIVGAVGMGAAAGDAAAEAAAAGLMASGGGLIGWGFYFIVTSILCFIFVGKAQKELADETTENKKPFIFTIVFGAIASNVFYVLAGIFGLIAEGQQGQQQAE